MKFKTCSFSSIIRASGIYDVVIMLPFALPGISSWTLTQIQVMHDGLYLSGSVPEFSPFHLLFVNLLACVSIVWAVLRVKNPVPVYGVYDTIARALIALTMLIYLLIYDVTGILWLFVVSEIAWAALQINGYFFKYKYYLSSDVKVA